MQEKEILPLQQETNPLDPKDSTLAVLADALHRLKEQKVIIRSLLVGERWQHPEGYFPELTLSGRWFEQAGFKKGQRVILSIQPSLILIRTEGSGGTKG